MEQVVDKDGYRVLQFTEKQWREDPEFVNCVGVTLDRIRRDNHLNMMFWIVNVNRPGLGWSEDPVVPDAEPCQTAGCLAGHAYLALKVGKRVRTMGEFRKLPDGMWHDWMKEGRRLLGLTGPDAHQLFVVEHWPSALRARYASGNGKPADEQQRIRFNALVDAVEWMIAKRETKRSSKP